MAVYQFAIFPMVHDFEILVLVLAPLFLVVGVLISMPKTAGTGLAHRGQWLDRSGAPEQLRRRFPILREQQYGAAASGCTQPRS